MERDKFLFFSVNPPFLYLVFVSLRLDCKKIQPLSDPISHLASQISSSSAARLTLNLLSVAVEWLVMAASSLVPGGRPTSRTLPQSSPYTTFSAADHGSPVYHIKRTQIPTSSGCPHNLLTFQFSLTYAEIQGWCLPSPIPPSALQILHQLSK